MIELPITPEQRKIAKEITDKETKTNSNPSGYGYDYNRIYVGHLAEKIVADYLNIKMDNTFEYDLISEKNKKLEVKTITCQFKPYKDYFATVNSYLNDEDKGDDKTKVHKQKADYYVFTRMTFDESTAWIVGWITCEEFFKQGTFVPKGSKFPWGEFVLADATIIEIYKLTQFKNKSKSKVDNKTLDKIRNLHNKQNLAV